MTLTDIFDRTYVLNLPERADRRREVSATLRSVGMIWTPGQVELFTAIRPDSPEPFRSVGARGCYLSHLGMLKKAREIGVQRLLVLEDDVDLDIGLADQAGVLLDRLQHDDWGIAYLGHLLPPLEAIPKFGTLATVDSSLAIGTTHCYAVHGQIFDLLINFLELVLSRPPGHPDGGPMHVDGAYSMFRRQNPSVLTLVARPNLGWQRSSSSDISTRWIDQAPLIRDVVRVARLVKRQLKRSKA